MTVRMAALTGGLLLLAAALRAQCPDGTPPPCGPGVPGRSVAVLTFDNVTRDTTAEYMAEGLADQIFTRLSQIERLTVISRTAVRRLHNADQLSVQQLGRALSVAYLVNGSVRMAGGRLHVNVEALRSSSGASIWSNAYDRPQDDLVGLEESIATEVASGIAGRLTPEEQRALAVRVTRNGNAYSHYVHGNVLIARRTPEAIRAAIDDYRQAIAADPGLSDAHARLAYAWALCVNWSACGADTALAFGRQAADQAIRLDPRSAEGWLGRAYIVFQSYSSLPATPPESLTAAYLSFERSVRLDPRNAEAWHQYGATLWFVSDSAAEDYIKRALALDPTRAVSHFDLGYLYLSTRRFAQALAEIDSALALDPSESFGSLRPLTLLESGDTAAAVAEARQHPGAPWSQEILGAFGADSSARRVMDARAAGLSGLSPSVLGADYRVAVYLLWVGRRDAGFEALGRSVVRFWRPADLRSALFDFVRDDPRFRALSEPQMAPLAHLRWH